MAIISASRMCSDSPLLSCEKAPEKPDSRLEGPEGPPPEEEEEDWPVAAAEGAESAEDVEGPLPEFVDAAEWSSDPGSDRRESEGAWSDGGYATTVADSSHTGKMKD